MSNTNKKWLAIKLDGEIGSIDSSIIFQLKEILVMCAKRHLMSNGKPTVQAWALAEGMSRMRLHRILSSLNLKLTKKGLENN
jgi:hypothetical protein